MATQLQLVNRVLLRLREDQVASTTESDYSTLISEFISDAYKEVLDAHTWEVFKANTVVDVLAAQSIYDLSRTITNSGDIRDGSNVVKLDSELLFLEGDIPEATLFDSDSDETENYLTYLSPEAFRIHKKRDRTLTNLDPNVFTLYQRVVSDESRMTLEVYPAPTTTRVFEAMFWTSPTPFETDGTTDTANVLIPDRPVFHLALMYSLNERGEEIGEPGNLAERRYLDAVAVAIERDVNTPGRADRNEWRRD